MQSLRDSEARASRVLQSIGDAVIVTDADTRVTRMNRVTEQMTCWMMKDAEGELFANVFQIVSKTTRQPMESSTDAIVGVDRNWVMTYLNPRATEIYASDREIIGRTVWEDFPHAVYEGSPHIEHYYEP